MAPWYFLNLGDAMLVAEPSAEVEELFLKAFEAAGNPSDMAVFTRHESEGRLQCEVMAYFSPAAHEVAERLEARPCPKPARAELGLLAGSQDAWQVLFPENQE
jgi:hypothetical protein